MTLPNGCSKYGADMGRGSTPCDPAFSGTFSALELAFVDGDYDSGGAYWGSGEPVWRLTAEDEDGQIELYYRAKDFDALREKVKRLFPAASVAKEIGEDRLDEFVLHYERTALWSSTDEEGEPLDNESREIADETLVKWRKDCKAFLEKADPIASYESDSDLAHDFWLTRNGHGAGFWDGDYEKEIGKKLTALSEEFGEVDLYVGDDGKVYQG